MSNDPRASLPSSSPIALWKMAGHKRALETTAGDDMAFVNEWVSEEDVKKYDLPSVWMKVKGSTPFQYVWTVDRERNAFLIDYQTGREEFSNHISFVLCWDGEIFVVTLVKHDASKSKEEMATRWQLIGIDWPAASTHSKHDVMNMLKDALRAYKKSGVVWPIEDHTAIFDF